ncbi:hypothetical protein EGT07_07165 [Herbaspirillum sp. HC18]|nr:hypothetical protein EGT07_07165 [Herbaspirillum sp. HC18]
MVMIHSKYSLNDAEKRALLQVAESSLQVGTIPDFKTWISGPVRNYFPHEAMVCAIGQIFGEEVHIRHLLGVNCPDGCIERFGRITSLRERSIVQRWLSQHRAQVIRFDDMHSDLTPQERENAIEVGLSNLSAFGCLDVDGHGGTYFSFGQIPGMPSARHAYKLELLIPYLHQGLMRAFHNSTGQMSNTTGRAASLTRREQEILLLMSTGMSNRAIAEKLSRSELTIQNHVHTILKKLGARNRVEAVAMRGTVAPVSRAQDPGRRGLASSASGGDHMTANCS